MKINGNYFPWDREYITKEDILICVDHKHGEDITIIKEMGDEEPEIVRDGFSCIVNDQLSVWDLDSYKNYKNKKEITTIPELVNYDGREYKLQRNSFFQVEFKDGKVALVFAYGENDAKSRLQALGFKHKNMENIQLVDSGIYLSDKKLNRVIDS